MVCVFEKKTKQKKKKKKEKRKSEKSEKRTFPQLFVVVVKKFKKDIKKRVLP